MAYDAEQARAELDAFLDGCRANDIYSPVLFILLRIYRVYKVASIDSMLQRVVLGL